MQKQATKPILFLNGGVEDHEAYKMVLRSGVDFELRGPTLEDPTPLVLFKSQRYYGTDEIQGFLSRISNNGRD